MSGLYVPWWLDLLIRYWPVTLLTITTGGLWLFWLLFKFVRRHWKA